MSKEHFAATLWKVERAGVYQMPIQGMQDFFTAAEDNNLAVFRVDLGSVREKKGFLAAVARALAFPDWFGHNWDALEDCLTDLSWHPADGYVVTFIEYDAFLAAHREDFNVALQIFGAAADYWRREGVPFWTLVGVRPDGIAHLPDLT